MSEGKMTEARLKEIDSQIKNLVETLSEAGQVPGFWAQATIDLFAELTRLRTPVDAGEVMAKLKCQCGREVAPAEQYRCFDCSETFCKECAKKHLYDESDHARLHATLRLRTQQLDIQRLGRDDDARQFNYLREALAQAMIRCSLATGHGDTHADLLGEMEWQVKELSARVAELTADNQRAAAEHNLWSIQAIERAYIAGANLRRGKHSESIEVFAREYLKRVIARAALQPKAP